MTNLLNRSLGRYHILEQLGQGGMATVYKAYDTRLERDVAVKVLRTELFGQAVLERLQKRFEREARALAKLTHPNIVGVIDYGEHEGAPYLVMEYLPGGTLKQRLGKPMPWQETLRLLLPVARALDYAHEHNILHRDVKPSNILLTEKNEPMLTDFGIAKILDLEDGQTLTATGVGVGTPEYMSPEQGLGKPVDARTDVYSLGVVLYEMVTGRKPFQADTPMAVVVQHLHDPLPRPSQFAPDLPEAVEKILLKALAKQPQDRYASMAEFAAAMEKTLAGQQPATEERPQTVDRRPQTVDHGPSTVHRPPSALPSAFIIPPSDDAATIDQAVTDEAATVDQAVTGETVLQEEERRPQTEERQPQTADRPPSTVHRPSFEPSPLLPRWRAVLWISLGWAIGGAIGGTLGWTLEALPGTNDLIVLAIVFAIISAIGGFIISLSLHKEKVLASWKNVLWITASWAIGGTIGGAIVEPISELNGLIAAAIAFASAGAIGGFITSVVLRKEEVLASWKSVAWVTAGWAICWGIGLIITPPLIDAIEVVSEAISFAIAFAISWAIAGGIGGFATILVLRQEKPIVFWKHVLWIALGWAIGGAIGKAIGKSLGWEASIVINGEIVQTVYGLTSQEIGAAIGRAISGAIGGFATAIVLHKEKILTSWKNILWITLGWAIGLAIGGEAIGLVGGKVEGAIIGILGASVTVLVLRREKIFASWKNTLWMIAGWAIGWAIGVEIGLASHNLISNAILNEIVNIVFRVTKDPIISMVIANAIILGITWGISGALAGAIGGTIMLWRLRKEKLHRQSPTTE